MLESLLSAYLEKIQKNREDYGEKRKDKLLRFYMFVNCMYIIMLIISIVFLSVWSPVVISIIYIILICICYVIFEIKRNKNWKDNLEFYYTNLDVLRGVLKEQKLYEKNKIKQLIRKYKYSLQEEEEENRQREQNNINKINIVVLPMIGYIGGKLNGLIDNEILLVGAIIVLISFVVVGCLKTELMMLIDLLTGERTEKKKQLVKKLQDLLDTDFPIEDSDLL